MNTGIFFQELKDAIIQFRLSCSRHGTITGDGVDIDFGNGYFTLYAEVEDDDGDFVTCEQEFTIEDDEKRPFVAMFFQAYR